MIVLLQGGLKALKTATDAHVACEPPISDSRVETFSITASCQIFFLPMTFEYLGSALNWNPSPITASHTISQPIPYKPNAFVECNKRPRHQNHHITAHDVRLKFVTRDGGITCNGLFKLRLTLWFQLVNASRTNARILIQIRHPCRLRDEWV